MEAHSTCCSRTKRGEWETHRLRTPVASSSSQISHPSCASYTVSLRNGKLQDHCETCRQFRPHRPCSYEHTVNFVRVSASKKRAVGSVKVSTPKKRVVGSVFIIFAHTSITPD
uniref:Uncharacterized protein n=1 Tax=Nelumbo nucifera TaxID=4432 RepID=A0A822ZIK6_NELNU|nr:TPA_asm: hypothetical protein HUJ06_002927 [Nelumbo nucifera]